MMRKQMTVAAVFVVGVLLGGVVLTATGQKKTPKPASKAAATTARTTSSRSYTMPRYAVQWDSDQQLLLITDNAYSKLYFYAYDSRGGTKLTSIIDLRQTGRLRLMSLTAKTTRPAAKGKTGAKDAPTKKSTPSKKKPAPKKKQASKTKKEAN